MKRIVLAAIIAALPSASAYSQAPADKPAAAPAPAAREEAKPAAAAAPAPAPASQKEITVVQGPGQSAVKEDARHCLEHGDNTDIIKCAEPYLPLKMKK
jgi:hypothetical protein